MSGVWQHNSTFWRVWRYFSDKYATNMCRKECTYYSDHKIWGPFLQVLAVPTKISLEIYRRLFLELQKSYLFAHQARDWWCYKETRVQSLWVPIVSKSLEIWSIDGRFDLMSSVHQTANPNTLTNSCFIPHSLNVHSNSGIPSNPDIGLYPKLLRRAFDAGLDTLLKPRLNLGGSLTCPPPLISIHDKLAPGAAAAAKLGLKWTGWTSGLNNGLLPGLDAWLDPGEKWGWT